MTSYLVFNDVLEIHDDAVQQFGGTLGLRDAGALASALAQPAMEAFGVELYPTLTEKAAAYLYFIARNNAFVDGNKRTAYASAYLFLLMNGLVLRASTDEKFDLVLDAAQGRLPDVRAVAERLEPLISPLGKEG